MGIWQRLRRSLQRAASPPPLRTGAVTDPEPDISGTHGALPFVVPVLMVSYFPVRAGAIDRHVTGDVGAPLEVVRQHVHTTSAQVIDALQTGSVYHAYKDPNAQPSLRYTVVDSLEVLEPLPTWPKPGHRVPMTDYHTIMRHIDARTWVETRGVKEIWLWGYHGGVVDLWESNMAGPFGDVSNSDRDPHDLPVFGQTYTVYHYNYQRGPSEAVEDHMHQIEAVLGTVDRHLFWDRFVGKPGEGRCGWAHYPPNGVRDYDWANPSYVWTDIEDWVPEGRGRLQRFNCMRWRGDSLAWFVYWMQNVPGAHNGLTFRGRPLSNWWTFMGDYDRARRAGLGLVQ